MCQQMPKSILYRWLSGVVFCYLSVCVVVVFCFVFDFPYFLFVFLIFIWRHKSYARMPDQVSFFSVCLCVCFIKDLATIGPSLYIHPLRRPHIHSVRIDLSSSPHSVCLTQARSIPATPCEHWIFVSSIVPHKNLKRLQQTKQICVFSVLSYPTQLNGERTGKADQLCFVLSRSS